MDNALCTEGLCQNFFHPRNQVLNPHLYQAPDSSLDETFDASVTEPATEATQTTYESPVNRLIRERLRWIDEQEESAPTAADTAVHGLQQLFVANCQYADGANKAAACDSSNQTTLKVHERVMLESIWKKQVDKSNLKTNLFGGRGIPSTELSVSQVRLGKA
jgi:hypothetical protein